MSSDSTVAINNNKVYTSYFARAGRIIPDRRLVSIALSSPDNFGGKYYHELNPSPSLLSNYKQGKLSIEEYKSIYYAEVLNHLKPIEVYEQLKGKVMCCWEKPDVFCHRHLVLDWLRDNLGDNIYGGEI